MSNFKKFVKIVGTKKMLEVVAAMPGVSFTINKVVYKARDIYMADPENYNSMDFAVAVKKLGCTAIYFRYLKRQYRKKMLLG